MTYQIKNKNDLTGAMLVVRFPQEDLDEKALYTIEADQPPFLVPFRYRAVDGMAECTYCLGSRQQAAVPLWGPRGGDYVDFWTQVLQPLLDCDDWFLKPFSFVLDPRYLYADRDGAVSYLYIPAKTDGESFASLREMVLELSRAEQRHRPGPGKQGAAGPDAGLSAQGIPGHAPGGGRRKDRPGQAGACA